jgi:chemotaxis protein methyltransferase CheR
VDTTAHISFSGVPVPKRILHTRTKPTVAFRPKEELDEPIAPFIMWVLQQSGLVASIYRPSSLNRRLNACLRRLRASSAEAAQKLIESRPELLNVTLDVLLLGVSEFFRDAVVFEQLRKTIVPQLLQQSEHLRILSVGVSEGHELYSVAMLLAEADALHKCELHGVDCRPYAIARAKTGLFSERDIAGVSEPLRSRYFEKTRHRWLVNTTLRERIQFSVKNVLNLDGNDQYDMILFRNVALYLVPTITHCAWTLLWQRLKSNGMLICGKADNPPASLPLMRVSTCIYKKLGPSAP